jgi:hypothetical protein
MLLRGDLSTPVHIMNKLTDMQEITPYKWVHPNEER